MTQNDWGWANWTEDAISRCAEAVVEARVLGQDERQAILDFAERNGLASSVDARFAIWRKAEDRWIGRRMDTAQKMMGSSADPH